MMLLTAAKTLKCEWLRKSAVKLYKYSYNFETNANNMLDFALVCGIMQM